MTRSQGKASSQGPHLETRRSGALFPAIIMGVPLASGILAFIFYGPFKDNELARYVSHGVEQVEVFLFCGALGAFASKLWRAWRESMRAYARVGTQPCRSRSYDAFDQPSRGIRTLEPAHHTPQWSLWCV